MFPQDTTQDKRIIWFIIDNNIVDLTSKGDEFTTKAIDYIITNEDAQIEDMKDDFFLFRG